MKITSTKFFNVGDTVFNAEHKAVGTVAEVSHSRFADGLIYFKTADGWQFTNVSRDYFSQEEISLRQPSVHCMESDPAIWAHYQAVRGEYGSKLPPARVFLTAEAVDYEIDAIFDEARHASEMEG